MNPNTASRANRNELRQAINDVRDLTPNEIARALRSARITGRPGTTGHCPLALLMHGNRGGRFVVGQKFIVRQSGAQVAKSPTPANLAEFLTRFDRGDYKHLIAVPPRCAPPRAKRPSSPWSAQTPGKAHYPKRSAERLPLAKMAQRFPAAAPRGKD
jgi:hypothetical protein